MAKSPTEEFPVWEVNRPGRIAVRFLALTREGRMPITAALKLKNNKRINEVWLFR